MGDARRESYRAHPPTPTRQALHTQPWPWEGRTGLTHLVAWNIAAGRSALARGGRQRCGIAAPLPHQLRAARLRPHPAPTATCTPHPSRRTRTLHAPPARGLPHHHHLRCVALHHLRAHTHTRYHTTRLPLALPSVTEFYHYPCHHHFALPPPSHHTTPSALLCTLHTTTMLLCHTT